MTKKKTLEDPKTEFLLSFSEVLLKTARLAYEKDPTLDGLDRGHLGTCITRLEDTLQAVKFPKGFPEE